MNRNDFKVWQHLCAADDYVIIGDLAWKLNMLPRSVLSIIWRVDTPLIEWRKMPLSVKLNGTEEEKRLLYEKIGSEWCSVSEECKEAVRKAVPYASTLTEIASLTDGFSRYEVQMALMVMHDVECTAGADHKIYKLRNEMECRCTRA